jgi:exonuclease III
MKKIFLILFFGFLSLGIVFYFSEYTPQQITVTEIHKFKPLSYDERINLERKKQQEIILVGLVSRCKKFGWNKSDDVAACVQQEAYRDLQLEKQKYQIKLLEQELIDTKNSSQQRNLSNSNDEEPLFLTFLNAYAESQNTKAFNEMKKDIIKLQGLKNYNQRIKSAEAALNSLYRDYD